jgi:hypothetical protein
MDNEQFEEALKSLQRAAHIAESLVKSMRLDMPKDDLDNLLNSASVIVERQGKLIEELRSLLGRPFPANN